MALAPWSSATWLRRAELGLLQAQPPQPRLGPDPDRLRTFGDGCILLIGNGLFGVDDGHRGVVVGGFGRVLGFVLQRALGFVRAFRDQRRGAAGAAP